MEKMFLSSTENNLQDVFSIFPNPFQDKVHVETKSSIQYEYSKLQTRQLTYPTVLLVYFYSKLWILIITHQVDSKF